MALYPYLFFAGNCRQAFARHREIFGGDLQLITGADMPPEDGVPPEHADAIMHAALVFDGGLLMGSDDPSGGHSGVSGMMVNYSAATESEAERVFGALGDGGQVTLPLAPTSFSPKFGMCVDRFGIPWMISTEQPDQSP